MSKSKNIVKKKFQTANVISISLAHLFHDIYASFLAPILPLLITKLGINYSLASLLTVAQRSPSLLSPFIGILADKVKMRYLIIVTPAITTVAMSLVGIAPTYSLLITLVIVAGLSSTFFHVPSPVMMKKVAGYQTGKGMSFYMLGGELARTLGPITILGAVSLWGLEGTYRLLPFGLIASVLLYFRLRNIDISEDVKKTGNEAGFKKTLKKFLPFFLILAGYLFGRAIMQSALTFFLPTYLNLEKGESLWFSGISLSVLQLAGAVGTFLSGTISDKIGRSTTLIVVSIISPIMMWFFITSENNVMMFVFLILIGIFHFASGPVLLALIQDLNADKPAFVNSIFMTISFGLSSVAVLLIGFLSDEIGLETTFKISAIIALTGIPFVFFLKKK
ncbi:MAG: MFS transporter [Bacteroidota bacterium]|nr:MFS transporter [Bacteroidota bacterium]